LMFSGCCCGRGRRRGPCGRRWNESRRSTPAVWRRGIPRVCVQTWPERAGPGSGELVHVNADGECPCFDGATARNLWPDPKAPASANIAGEVLQSASL
jgi:hypothetical protein